MKSDRIDEVESRKLRTFKRVFSMIQKYTCNDDINEDLRTREKIIPNNLGITECINDKENLQHRLLELISNTTARSKLIENQSQLHVNENSLLQ